DQTAHPSFVAADLLSQAEHGPDSQVVLVSLDLDMLEQVSAELKLQVEALPRKEIALKALDNSVMIYFKEPKDASDWINLYAPEHYIIALDQPDFFVNSVQNAGSVFIGHYTPESAGDYASGTNHTLPTNGYAKQYSGVHLDSFQKQITFQEIQPHGLSVIGPAVELMAAAEGLEAHKQAVTKRLITLNQTDEEI
ncbi:MAG: histidinol dehydrogenase, partial [Flavobacteriaceae bacterium]